MGVNPEILGTVKLCGGVLGRALGRLWGRDVMLYVGGVSFFALLAFFPGLAILIGLYGLLFTPDQAGAQAATLSHMVPSSARLLFETELQRLTLASARTVSTQSAVAAVIGAYAAHRGFKALLAGLTFIHDEDEPHGFLRFNLLAFIVAVAAFALFTVVSGVIVGSRVMRRAAELEPIGRMGLFDNEWIWAAVGLTFGLTLLYRYAMSHSGRVIWRASILGGASAAILTIAASWATAFYVEQIAELGATYGSVGAVVVFLIWLSWNINAVFFGGALATEVEIALHEYRGRRAPPSAHGVEPGPRTDTKVVKISSARRASRQ